MFVIKRETDLEVIKKLGYNENDLVMCVRENGTLTGHSHSTFGDSVEMKDIVCEDKFMFDNLFRATLNYVAVHNLGKVTIDNNLFERMKDSLTPPETAEIEDADYFLMTHRLCNGCSNH